MLIAPGVLALSFDLLVQCPSPMAPKEPKEKKKNDDSDTGLTKADFSVFNMAMKSAMAKGDATKTELWKHYTGLSRFDQEKAEMIKKFKEDKSCSWWLSYSARSFKSKASVSTVDVGWGSRGDSKVF